MVQDFRNKIYNIDSVSSINKWTNKWTNRISKPGIRAIYLVLCGL